MWENSTNQQVWIKKNCIIFTLTFYVPFMHMLCASLKLHHEFQELQSLFHQNEHIETTERRLCLLNIKKFKLKYSTMKLKAPQTSSLWVFNLRFVQLHFLISFQRTQLTISFLWTQLFCNLKIIFSAVPSSSPCFVTLFYEKC